jgi:hypothetical protein
MKKPGPRCAHSHRRASPRTRVPFRCNGRSRRAFFFLHEPIRIGSSCRSPLKRARQRPRSHVLSATSPGGAFAPSSATGLELACARTSSGYTFRAEIVPGNVRARVHLSPRTRTTDSLAARALGTRVLCLFYLFLEIVLFTEYEILTAVCHFSFLTARSNSPFGMWGA